MALSLSSIAALAGSYPSRVKDFSRQIFKLAESVKAYVDAGVAALLVDEDNMVSDSDELAPTQQSVKAYVDGEVSTLEAAIADVPNSSVKYLAATADDFELAAGDGFGTVIVNDEITVTMPEVEEGRVIRFLQTAVAVLTIAQNDGEEIAGATASYVSLDAAGDTATFYCDGTNWLLVESSIAA